MHACLTRSKFNIMIIFNFNMSRRMKLWLAVLQPLSQGRCPLRFLLRVLLLDVLN